MIDFERPRLDDKLYLENKHPHGFDMDLDDGLPKPSVQVTMEDTEAADLTPSRFVCMGTPGIVLPILGQVTGRAPCKHYRRQLLPSANKENVVCIRHCTATRGETGEYSDLGNTEVLACEFREPRDPVSERQLAAFDLVIMQRQKERKTEEAVFDVDVALGEKE